MTHPFHQYMKHLSYGGTELIFSSANDGKHLSFVTSSTSCHTLSTEAAHDSTQGDEVFPSPPHLNRSLVGYLSDSFVSKRRRGPLRVSSVVFGDEPGGEPEPESEPE